MRYHDSRRSAVDADFVAPVAPTPGRRTLTQDLAPRREAAPSAPAPASLPVQRRATPTTDEQSVASLTGLGSWSGDWVQRRSLVSAASDDAMDVHAHAAVGTSGAGGALPFADRIQASFGRHDISDVRAHTDGAARQGARGMGAEAFATGNQVAFAGAPSLHTAAHEAAHVVQQRAGVHLKGGVGQDGDVYERHADAVADRVVRGESAQTLLDEYAPGAAGSGRTGIQMAGHAGVMIFGSVDGKGVVLKRVEQTEANEYRRVMAEQHSDNATTKKQALGTFPVVYGVYADLNAGLAGTYAADKLNPFKGKHDDEDWYIEIASVKEDRTDSIKDFKIGTHTTNAAELVRNEHKPDEDAALKKVAREDISDTLTESRKYGLRDSDEMRTKKGAGIFMGKLFGSKRDFLAANTLASIQGKMRAEGKYPKHSVVFDDLNNIEQYITASNTVYVASSLIMNWSADRQWRDARDQVRLIDLAHPIKTGEDGFDDAKNGMLLGIQNLRRILQGEGLETGVEHMEQNPLHGAQQH